MPVFGYVIFLHVFAVIWGMQRGGAEEARLLGEGLGITFGILVVLACSRDACDRGRPLVGMVKFLMFIAWPVAGPVYLVGSRGWRGALWALLWGVTLMACFVGAAMAAVALRAGRH